MLPVELMAQLAQEVSAQVFFVLFLSKSLLFFLNILILMWRCLCEALIQFVDAAFFFFF